MNWASKMKNQENREWILEFQFNRFNIALVFVLIPVRFLAFNAAEIGSSAATLQIFRNRVAASTITFFQLLPFVFKIRIFRFELFEGNFLEWAIKIVRAN